MTINVFGGGYNPLAPVFPVQRSVRLRSSASAYFNRTPASATNRQKYTLSLWFKRGTLGTNQALFSASDGTQNNEFLIYFDTNNALVFQQTVGGSAAGQISCATSAVFRDPSSWYHAVVAIDTTQATSTNRLILYINGVTQTFSSYSVGSSINTWVDNTNPHALGKRSDASLYFDGYMTEVNFVDGQQLTPASFGAYNAGSGVWQPIRYSGTYGTNGFYLNFNDNSAATAAAIGKDSSGNGNNWTPNNISVTAGVTYDSMLDVPTLTSATNANFAVMNPIVPTGASVISGGNLNIVGVATYCNGLSTINLNSGSYYAECVVNTHVAEGWGVWDITKSAAANTGTTPSGFYGIYSGGATLMSNGTNVTTNAAGTPANGDILQVAWNNGKVWLGKNNTWYDSSFGTTGNPSAGTNATFTGLTVSQFAFIFGIGNGATSLSANFGQRPFTYTPPSGFKSLNTYNLPAPTIPNGATQFAATTYTGNGTSLAVTNTVNGKSFQPDFIWIKDRSNARSNVLQNSVTGAAQYLISDTTGAEATASSGVTSINSNGFTVGTQLTWNGSAETYVGWQWKAGGTAVTNTSGSITSSVSANPSAGFSIVTYTGTGANATVGHGLGVTPAMIIVKCRVNGTPNWRVWHKSLGTTDSYLGLNQTAAVASSTTVFNSQSSTTFGIGTDPATNSASAMVAYCFAEIAGYSKFGSYTGNGSTDGVFVYLGFRPRFVLVKSSSAVEGWVIWDSSRNTYNTMPNVLYPNLSNAEGGSTNIDFLSNGFKLRNSATNGNITGVTYIYAAFAENPFSYSLAR